MIAAGRCPNCGKRMDTPRSRCSRCLTKVRESARKRLNCKRRYRAASYLFEGAADYAEV